MPLFGKKAGTPYEIWRGHIKTLTGKQGISKEDIDHLRKTVKSATLLEQELGAIGRFHIIYPNVSIEELAINLPLLGQLTQDEQHYIIGILKAQCADAQTKTGAHAAMALATLGSMTGIAVQYAAALDSNDGEEKRVIDNAYGVVKRILRDEHRMQDAAIAGQEVTIKEALHHMHQRFPGALMSYSTLPGILLDDFPMTVVADLVQQGRLIPKTIAETYRTELVKKQEVLSTFVTIFTEHSEMSGFVGSTIGKWPRIRAKLIDMAARELPPLPGTETRTPEAVYAQPAEGTRVLVQSRVYADPAGPAFEEDSDMAQRRLPREYPEGSYTEPVVRTAQPPRDRPVPAPRPAAAAIAAAGRGKPTPAPRPERSQASKVAQISAIPPMEAAWGRDGGSSSGYGSDTEHQPSTRVEETVKPISALRSESGGMARGGGRSAPPVSPKPVKAVSDRPSARPPVPPKPKKPDSSEA